MKEIITSDYAKLIEEERDVLREIQDAINKGSATITVLNDKDIFGSRKVNIISTNFAETMTQNYVGVLHYKTDDEEVTVKILSRFDKADPNQQFLNYMLHKVGDSNIHITHEMSALVSKDTMLKRLFFLRFIELLQLAHKKGIYRQYRTLQYNDPKLKGSLNINRYIKRAGLKDGNITYDVRERVINNPINVLLLQAYEKMLKDGDANIRMITEQMPAIRAYIQQLEKEIPTYSSYDVHKLLKETKHAVTHPYYLVIEELRKVARDILMNRGIDIFLNSRTAVHGVLLDVNLLWEQFVVHMLNHSPHMEKYKVKSQQHIKVLNLGNNNSSLTTIIPDTVFYDGDKPVFILDAKHKLKWQQVVIDGEVTSSFRDDIFQIVSYMNFLSCHSGGVIFPYSREDEIVSEKLEARKLSPSATQKSFLTIPLRIMEKGKGFIAAMDEECERVTKTLYKSIQTLKDMENHKLIEQEKKFIRELGLTSVTPEQLAAIKAVLAKRE